MHHPIDNWSEVVKLLTKSNDNQKKNNIDNLRKLTYRSALEKQIEQHSKQAELDRNRKQKQRQKLVADGQKMKNQQVNKKINKITTEQWYQIQNLDLIKSKKNRKSDQSDEKRTDSNQFFKLEDGEKQRKMKTRKNFEMQNMLNNKQSEIHSLSKSRQKKLNLYEKEIQYQKQQSDRQLWKNKYLYDQSIRQAAENHNYRYAYRAFLKKQMEEKQKRIKNESQKIDEKIKGINQSVDKINSSPAYFGIDNESFDRKRQLSLIDKHLQLDQKKIKEKLNQNVKRQQFTTEQKRSRGQYSHPQFNVKKESLAQIRENATAARYGQRSIQSQAKMKQRQFTSYDFITGTHKTFFA